MHFHSQNLNEKPGGRMGSILRHGRCWWRITERLKLHAEWLIPSGKFSLSAQFGGDDDDLLLSFGCGLFTVYFGICAPGLSWLPRGRVSQIYWFQRALWIYPWSRRWEHRSSDPWWSRGKVIHFDDLLLGRTSFSTRTLARHQVLIPMAEGAYPATVRIEERTWKRPRWFARHVAGADIDIPGGIPFMGKGENSWDCGEDGLFGMSCPAASVEEAIGKVVATVLTSRRKYGRPADIKPVLSPRVKVAPTDDSPKEAA